MSDIKNAIGTVEKLVCRMKELKLVVEKLKSNNNGRDVICSSKVCDYCRVEKRRCKLCRDFSRFQGRKLTPAS